MPKPGLWPPYTPRTTESHAEQAVYAALSKHLPKGWYAWHSVRLRTTTQGDAEADFIIADPKRGALILEVKGGRIEQRDGLWYSNSQRLKYDPRKQALRFQSALKNLLYSKKVSPPALGVVTVFPDTSFSDPPSAGDVASCVIGQQDLKWLDRALSQVMTRCLSHRVKPQGQWLQAIHDLWGELWSPRLNLGDEAGARLAEFVKFDAEQLEVLEGLGENDSVLVEGGAGTGKSVLAYSMALRLAERGQKVLYLCFTLALEHWLAKQTSNPNLMVRAIKRYAVDLLELADRQVYVHETPEFWGDISSRAVTEALPEVQPRWDAVFVDESQDLADNDWQLIAELSRGRRLWAFFDPEQTFWEDRQIRKDLFKVLYRLNKAYRCPDSILALAKCYLERPPDHNVLPETNAVTVRPCPSRSSVPEKIALEIGKLLSDGLQPEQIAILSLRGVSETESIVSLGKLGIHRVVRAVDPEVKSHVVVETFLKFKGLERPAIIITDVHLAIDKPDYAKRMYIALTRALAMVRIIDSHDALFRDPILRQLWEHS
jgi:hypothetical protein